MNQSALPGGRTRVSDAVVGAALGAPTGGAAGAAAARLLRRRRQTYHATTDTPNLRLHVSARYGANLKRVAETVRSHVREALREMAGLEAGAIEVVFAKVIPPAP